MKAKETDTKKYFSSSPNHAYPPPTPSSSSHPRPLYSKKFQSQRKEEIDEDDGNSADNEKSVLYSSLSSPLRPPLPPSRSPFHHPPPSQYVRDRERKRKEDKNEEGEIIDLLAATPPSVFNGKSSTNIFTDNEIESLDDLKSISLGIIVNNCSKNFLFFRLH